MQQSGSSPAEAFRLLVDWQAGRSVYWPALLKLLFGEPKAASSKNKFTGLASIPLKNRFVREAIHITGES
jgi:hypothetical protein